MMTPILAQFISESRDFLQGISEKLIELEAQPDDAVLMGELFRFVHTLKGNCGLFDFPEMMRVLHAGEDLMSAVRDAEITYTQELADALLEGMDFVSVLLDEIEEEGRCDARHAQASANLAASLRELIGSAENAAALEMGAVGVVEAKELVSTQASAVDQLISKIPEALRAKVFCETLFNQDHESVLTWVSYTPEAECFFKGEDPLFLAMNLPDLVWVALEPVGTWPDLELFNPFESQLVFHLLTRSSNQQVQEHFRYVTDQVSIAAIQAYQLVHASGTRAEDEVKRYDFVEATISLLEEGDVLLLDQHCRAMLELCPADSWFASTLRWILILLEFDPRNREAIRQLIDSILSFSSPQLCDITSLDESADESENTYLEDMETLDSAVVSDPTTLELLASILSVQVDILRQSSEVIWFEGRLKAVATTVSNGFTHIGATHQLPIIAAHVEKSLQERNCERFATWLAQQVEVYSPRKSSDSLAPDADASVGTMARSGADQNAKGAMARRNEEGNVVAKTLKVDQEKIDRLMNLIGEIVVSKNALPYLAAKAENVYGSRDLSREIKAQYAVINRIAEEMQDAIMQIRMLPVSFVFQRFPRLVRDISRKLGKQVELVLEGESTEADKNVIEALADPLIHIVRNSLDHGFEEPEVRARNGKPAVGTLLIRATQDADRVVIDIRDDGRGIDPIVIKRKALEKGIIDESTHDRMSDEEAINLVFAPGFSTAEAISDLSGRGVGMDVVRAAVESVNGSVHLTSEVSKGTCIRLSLPLSMSISNVMVVESAGQQFGIPMDVVQETVRIPATDIHMIKSSQTVVLRGRVVPLRSLNELLANPHAQKTNAEGEYAILVIQVYGGCVGIIVDSFNAVFDIILKPMNGILGGLTAYSGSALMGDGSVLMVLNPRELIK